MSKRWSLVAAMDKGRVIGREGGLPWHLPEDLRHFKRTTVGKAVVMGRKTYESVGRPLPKRVNIVLTRDASYSAEGCIVVQSLDEVEPALAHHDVEEIAVVGGAEVYARALPRVTHMHLTFIEASFEGDTFFPAFDEQAWTVTDERCFEPDGENAHRMRFVTFERAP